MKLETGYYGWWAISKVMSTGSSPAIGRSRRSGHTKASTSQADQRAPALWDLWREQKDRSEHLGRSPSCTREKSDAAVDVLVGIEDLLQASISSSVHALAATLMIAARDERTFLAYVAPRSLPSARNSSELSRRTPIACWLLPRKRKPRDPKPKGKVASAADIAVINFKPLSAKS
jgi:hypothetical protein